MIDPQNINKAPGHEDRLSSKALLGRLVARVRAAVACDAETVNDYYTACIPFFREFLGDHWHTGFYRFEDVAIGPGDQLRMERQIAAAAVSAGAFTIGRFLAVKP